MFSGDGGMLFQGLTFFQRSFGLPQFALNGIYDNIDRCRRGDLERNMSTPQHRWILRPFILSATSLSLLRRPTILKSRTAGNYNSVFLTETNQFRMSVGGVYNETEGPRSGGGCGLSPGWPERRTYLFAPCRPMSPRLRPFARFFFSWDFFTPTT